MFEFTRGLLKALSLVPGVARAALGIALVAWMVMVVVYGLFGAGR